MTVKIAGRDGAGPSVATKAEAQSCQSGPFENALQVVFLTQTNGFRQTGIELTRPGPAVPLDDGRRAITR